MIKTPNPKIPNGTKGIFLDNCNSKGLKRVCFDNGKIAYIYNNEVKRIYKEA